MAGQNTSGGWSYNCPKLSTHEAEQLLALLQKQPHLPILPVDSENSGQNLPSNQLKSVAERLPVVQFKAGQKVQGIHGDNSNTQFAILGLWAARKHGVPTSRSLGMAEVRFRQWQAKDGSWCYSGPNGSWKDSMTCAGLIGLGAGKGSQSGAPAKDQTSVGELGDDANIQRGLTFLGNRLKALSPLFHEEQQKLKAELAELHKELAVANKGKERAALQQREQALNKRLAAGLGGKAHADAHGDLYFIWSIERVGVLFDLATIGGVDWHAWGTDILLHIQHPDGRWQDSHNPPIDTCFALLFLKRVNVAHDLTKVLQGLGGVRDPGAKPGEGQRGTAEAAFNKANPSLQPGAAKVRTGYALPAAPPPASGARRRRRPLAA